jgi:hypothetical protein
VGDSGWWTRPGNTRLRKYDFRCPTTTRVGYAIPSGRTQAEGLLFFFVIADPESCIGSNAEGRFEIAARFRYV